MSIDDPANLRPVGTWIEDFVAKPRQGRYLTPPHSWLNLERMTQGAGRSREPAGQSG